MERLQDVSAIARIKRLNPFYRPQQIDWEFVNYSRNLEGFDPEIFLPGFAEDLRPGKLKAFCQEENVGHVLGFASAQGAQLVREDISPVVDAGKERRFLKITVVKRHVVDEIDLEGRLTFAG